MVVGEIEQEDDGTVALEMIIKPVLPDAAHESATGHIHALVRGIGHGD